MTNEQLAQIEARAARAVEYEDDAANVVERAEDIANLCAALRESQRLHAECADAWADEHHERTEAEMALRRARAENERLRNRLKSSSQLIAMYREKMGIDADD